MLILNKIVDKNTLSIVMPMKTYISPRVKICGITNLNDALVAAKYGADAIGIRIRPKLNLDSAKRIIKLIPPFLTPVLLTKETSLEIIVEHCRYLGINTLQTYGNITSNSIEILFKEIPGIKIIRAFPVIDDSSILYAKELEEYADALLLDTQDKESGQVGGTGKSHDWNISREIVLNVKIPVMLAGGLNPNNIKEAINFVRCWGVDCESGVEKSDGIKDINKVKDFIRICKSISF